MTENKVLSVEENLQNIQHILLDALEPSFSNSTIQDAISRGNSEVAEEVSNLKSSIDEIGLQVKLMRTEMQEMVSELSNLQELSDIKYSLDSIASTLYNHYNKK
jgi:uncharacterized coiled-coil DUF342 family protein